MGNTLDTQQIHKTFLFGGTGVRTQSFVLFRQALYHLSHANSPVLLHNQVIKVHISSNEKYSPQLPLDKML
jgi:hypothetical protein